VVEETTSIPALATKAALNDIFTIGRDGFKNMATTVQYGDLAQYDAGKKVNPALSMQVIDANARLWYIPSRNQMIVKTSSNKTSWLFHYSIADEEGLGAWTRRTFVSNLNDVWEDGNTVYLAYGCKVCCFSSSVQTDDGTVYTSEIEGKSYRSRYLYNISRYILDLDNRRDGVGTLQLGEYTRSMTYGTSEAIDLSDNDEAYSDIDEAYSDSRYASYDNGEAYSDGDEAYSDTDTLFDNPVRYSKFIDTKQEQFSFHLTCTTGAIGVRYAGLDIAEV
jgi:hypothetical protein